MQNFGIIDEPIEMLLFTDVSVIVGTFAVEIHPNLFAFGVLTTLFSFAILAIYGLLMSISIRRARGGTTGLQEEIG